MCRTANSTIQRHQPNDLHLSGSPPSSLPPSPVLFIPTIQLGGEGGGVRDRDYHPVSNLVYRQYNSTLVSFPTLTRIWFQDSWDGDTNPTYILDDLRKRRRVVVHKVVPKAEEAHENEQTVAMEEVARVA